MTANEKYFAERHGAKPSQSVTEQLREQRERDAEASADARAASQRLAAKDTPRLATADGANGKRPRSHVERRRVVSVPAVEIERKQVAWALPGRIPYGYLTLLIGEQGLGKSTWLAWLAAENSRKGKVTLVCSAEDGWDTTVRPRLEAWEADLRFVRFVEVALEDSADGLLLPVDIAELSREIHDTGANVVTIDPVLAHLGHDIDSHRDASTRQALAPLARIAGEHGAAIICAHHLNKGNSADPLLRASASVAFTAQARSVLLWARDPEDADGERGSSRALAHVKSNLVPLAPTQLWCIEPIVLPAIGTQPEVETSRVALTGESTHTGRDLLTVREETKTDKAEDMLAMMLADGGWHDSAGLKTLAAASGFNERMLKRAAKDLGVEYQSRGFPRSTYWRLAPVGTPLTPSRVPTGDPAQPGHLRLVETPVGTSDPTGATSGPTGPTGPQGTA